MTHKNVYRRLGYRVSEEVQLLAEEKWILEALNKVKTQRNCLQIERLHLESMKAKLRSGSTNKSQSANDVNSKESDDSFALASTSAVNLMQNTNSAQIEVSIDLHNETTCNVESLNLGVPNFVFGKNDHPDFNMEEEDEESDDENMLIDMNMLMNCPQRKKDSNTKDL